MPVIRDSNVTVWICEGAGLVGMAATLAVCTLAYSAASPIAFWAAVAISLAGNLLYMSHVLTRRATGDSALSWRELVLANIVPAVALVVTVLMAGELGGLFHLPFAGADSAPTRVINLSPHKGA